MSVKKRLGHLDHMTRPEPTLPIHEPTLPIHEPLMNHPVPLLTLGVIRGGWATFWDERRDGLGVGLRSDVSEVRFLPGTSAG